MQRHIEFGLGSTLFAFTLPDSLISTLGKMALAVFTAALCSYVSALVTNKVRK